MKKFLTHSIKQKLLIPFVGIGVLLFILLGVYIGRRQAPVATGVVTQPASPLAMDTSTYPELASQPWKSWQFQQLKDYLQKLAQEKGAPYAYEVLKRAPIAPNTDLHLLGHVVGDVLYKQQGVDGMRVCTQDFRNACSHSIVVGLFSDYGEAALPKITDACHKAPGGSGAYTMCFHGLGHGILAAMGYDMKKGVATCMRIADRLKSTSESTECIGGEIMEITGGGDHDRELWAKQRMKYLSNARPLEPCSTSLIPDEAKVICYIYLTPHLFQAAGADLGHPGPEDFKKAFVFCSAIDKSNTRDRGACYGGFGKEFAVLAQDRDIRQDHLAKVTDAQLKTMNDWCMLANDKEGSAACIVNVVNSLYWGGENSSAAAVRFCNSISDNYYQGSCIMNLIGAVGYFKADQASRKEFCAQVVGSFRSACEEKLLSGKEAR